MNYSLIEEKYPKAYKAFEEWLLLYYINVDWLRCVGRRTDTSINTTGKVPRFFDFPFPMQVGVLEMFFDERGIYAYASRRVNSKGESFWRAIVNDTSSDEKYHAACKPFAQQAAFERAFALLNEQLT